MQARLIVVAAAAFLAASCGGKGEGDVSANADTGLTAESISSNDVTAIDAVTGQAANMAADVDFTNLPANATASGGNAAAAKPGARPRPESSPARPSESNEAAPPPAAAVEPVNATE